MTVIFQNSTTQNYTIKLNIEITEMEQEDIDEVWDIENQCFTSPWTRDAFEQELCIESSKVFLAKKYVESQKTIVGYICLWTIIDEIHVLNIAIPPNFRRMGIATSLMNSCLEFSSFTGAKSITLEVRKSNFPAISLYRKYGFEVKGIRPGYYADNFEDAFVMSLQL